VPARVCSRACPGSSWPCPLTSSSGPTPSVMWGWLLCRSRGSAGVLLRGGCGSAAGVVVGGWDVWSCWCRTQKEGGEIAEIAAAALLLLDCPVRVVQWWRVGGVTSWSTFWLGARSNVEHQSNRGGRSLHTCIGSASLLEGMHSRSRSRQ